MAMYKVIPAVCLLLLSGCAEPAGTADSVRITFRSPGEFCEGTGRSIAIERYNMKSKGAALKEALERNNGVPVIDAITRAVYGSESKSETQAAAVGTKACLNYFRGR